MKKRTLKWLVRAAVILSAIVALFFTVRISTTSAGLVLNRYEHEYATEKWHRATTQKERDYWEKTLQQIIAERKAMNSATQWYLSPLFARSNLVIKIFLLFDICFVDYWITKLLVVMVKSYIQMKRRKKRRPRRRAA